MAAVREAPDLIYAGRLLRVDFEGAGIQIQIEKEAITFLQKLAEPITVVTFHGAKGSGKTACVHDLVARENPNPEPNHANDAVAMPTAETANGVWLYVKRANYSNVKYIAFIDRPGFGSNTPLEKLLHTILVGLSSVVIHHVDGQLTSEALANFAFLGPTDADDAAKSTYAFPQSPKLLWLLQNVSSSQLKEVVGETSLPAQELEHAYLRMAMESASSASDPFVEQFSTAFPDQTCTPLPRADSTGYDKRIDKLLRVLMESGRNRYQKGVQLNGPLFGSILVSMLAHRDNVYQAFRGRVWKEVIHNCCLNIVESGIKLYKSRMAEQLGGIVDTSDLHDYTPLFTPKEPLPPVDLPCETDLLESIHYEAKRTAKMNLRTMPVRSGKLNALLKKLFKDLIASLYDKIREANNRMSSDLCRALLKEFHAEMTKKVQQKLEIPPHADDDTYAVQTAQFKGFFHSYQMYLFDLIGEYTERARGPMKRKELSQFCHGVIRLQLKDLSTELKEIREGDVGTLEDAIEDNEQKIEDANTNQKLFQREAMNAQNDVNKELVEVARLQAIRKEALESAIEDLDSMHVLATKQKQLLEEAAFVSVQVPSQKVIEAAQETESTQLQGYLIKQGAGGNAFNPLGRRNWKQRYFILIGDRLVYAKTKDEYERGRIIKELQIPGCRVEPSKDAGEGFDIIPPQKGSHVYELQRGLFEKNSRKKSSLADSGRVFKLRAMSLEERDSWLKALRKAAGGYK